MRDGSVVPRYTFSGGDQPDCQRWFAMDHYVRDERSYSRREVVPLRTELDGHGVGSRLSLLSQLASLLIAFILNWYTKSLTFLAVRQSFPTKDGRVVSHSTATRRRHSS